MKGCDDFVSVFCFELPPGSKSCDLRHLYEEIIYVMDGHGSTQIETTDGKMHSFEWGPNSLFSVPLNAKYQHFNGSGTEPARLASIHNFRFLINMFRNEEFIFNTEQDFTERLGPNGYFQGRNSRWPPSMGNEFCPRYHQFRAEKLGRTGQGFIEPALGPVRQHPGLPYFPDRAGHLQKGPSPHCGHQCLHHRWRRLFHALV
jgi:hypothetical protein